MEGGAAVAAAEQLGVVEGGWGEGRKAEGCRLRTAGSVVALREAEGLLSLPRSAARAFSASSILTRSSSDSQLRLPSVSLCTTVDTVGTVWRTSHASVRSTDERTGRSIALVAASAAVGAA